MPVPSYIQRYILSDGLLAQPPTDATAQARAEFSNALANWTLSRSDRALENVSNQLI